MKSEPEGHDTGDTNSKDEAIPPGHSASIHGVSPSGTDNAAIGRTDCYTLNDALTLSERSSEVRAAGEGP